MVEVNDSVPSGGDEEPSSDIECKRDDNGTVTLVLSEKYFDKLADLIEAAWEAYDTDEDPAEQELVSALYLVTSVVRCVDDLAESEGGDDDEAV